MLVETFFIFGFLFVSLLSLFLLTTNVSSCFFVIAPMTTSCLYLISMLYGIQSIRYNKMTCTIWSCAPVNFASIFKQISVQSHNKQHKSLILDFKWLLISVSVKLHTESVCSWLSEVVIAACKIQRAMSVPNGSHDPKKFL